MVSKRRDRLTTLVRVSRSIFVVTVLYTCMTLGPMPLLGVWGMNILHVTFCAVFMHTALPTIGPSLTPGSRLSCNLTCTHICVLSACMISTRRSRDVLYRDVGCDER